MIIDLEIVLKDFEQIIYFFRAICQFCKSDYFISFFKDIP
jgi:hypothetical protein